MLNISRLEKLMQERNLTKKDVLEACKLTRPTLDKIMRGGDFNVSTLESIASGLGVSVGYLFDSDDSPTNTAHISGEGNIALSGNNTTGDIHNGGESIRVKDLERLVEQLKSQLADKEKIIQLLER
jgi:transcriptional regulator with XRE-family HTH domain